uniref:Uncharacterized protein n=1 Tax=Anguilla anguilla TaxID=7936 RepID=A0A0E9WR88_ANGAN
MDRIQGKYGHTQEKNHKQKDSGVGHGIGQAQDPAAHDGITKIEDGHPKRGVSRVVFRIFFKLFLFLEFHS